MKMFISLKPIHTNCIGRENCQGCVTVAKEAIQEIGGKNIIASDNKVYFEYEDIVDLVVDLNSRGLKVEDWGVIK